MTWSQTIIIHENVLTGIHNIQSTAIQICKDDVDRITVNHSSDEYVTTDRWLGHSCGYTTH